MEGGLFMHAFSHKIYLMALNIFPKLSVISDSSRHNFFSIDFKYNLLFKIIYSIYETY